MTDITVTGANNQPMVILPWLSAEMNRRNATNERLAEAAGVSAKTVNSARLGGRIKHYTAELIRTALTTRTFTRDNRGPRGREQ